MAALPVSPDAARVSRLEGGDVETKPLIDPRRKLQEPGEQNLNVHRMVTASHTGHSLDLTRYLFGFISLFTIANI